MDIVDSHCHAGLNWFEPVELLLYQMELNSVGRAVLIGHGGSFDNTYLLESAERFPGKFSVVVVIDHSAPDAPTVLREWADKGATGVRLGSNPQFLGREQLGLWQIAAELDLVVSCLGLPEDFASEEFAGLIREFSTLPIIIEHLAGVGPGARSPYATYKDSLALAKYPNTYIKIGGLGEISQRPPVLQPDFGFEHVPPFLQLAYDAFGARRMMWGSDYPPVSGREGYRNALRSIRDHSVFRRREEREWIMSRTAMKVFSFL